MIVLAVYVFYRGFNVKVEINQDHDVTQLSDELDEVEDPRDVVHYALLGAFILNTHSRIEEGDSQDDIDSRRQARMYGFLFARCSFWLS